MIMDKEITFIKKIFYIPLILVGMAILFYVLLIFVYNLPTETMNKHLVESSSIFQNEGSYPRRGKHGNSQLDNYTDAIMLLTAAYPETDNVWVGAIKAERYSLPKEIVESESPADILVYLYQESNEEAYSYEYARYWHGYLVFLKPLLMFLNYGEIRMLIKCVQIGLFAIVLLKILKRDWGLVIPLIATGIFLNLSVTTSSLQFNSVITITLLAMLLILQLDAKDKKHSLYFWGIVFLIIGSLTSYMDLLTFPMISLGMPLILWIIINFSESISSNIKRIAFLSIFWGVGYGGMWSLKWILGAVITKENLMADALKQIITRTSSTAFDNKVSYLDVVVRQIESSLQPSWALLVLILCVLWMIYVLIRKKVRWNLLVTLAVISLYPFIWFFCLKNHSYIHCWFTYRELAISLFALSSYIMLEICGMKYSLKLQKWRIL